ncbi:MAG: hypothetical protein ACRED5_20225 [Propylenella sp.]
MPPEKAARSKTQTLSLRLDPKTRFVLEFLSKLRLQSITTVVEEAIRQAGARLQVDATDEKPRSWRDYWDVNEGVRAMLMLADPDIPSNYEDDELRDFIAHHIEFFSETYELTNPDRINLAVLWPDIDHYVEAWQRGRSTSPWQAGEMMASALRDAEIDPPEWPRRSKTPPGPRERNSARPKLDDEIPF